MTGILLSVPDHHIKNFFTARSAQKEHALQHHMGMSDDDKTFQEYVDIMTACALRVLDKDLTWKMQRSSKRRLFIVEVRKALPVMSTYKNSWPVPIFGAIYLRHTRSFQNGRRKGGLQDQSHKEGLQRSISRDARTPPVAGPESGLERHETPSQLLRRSSISEPDAPDDSDESVLVFLRSLAMPLDHLLPDFRAIGVLDHSSLLVVASLPDRGDWLFRALQGRITCLQLKLIVDGLDKVSDDT
ncbi:uncharacterized protein BXZ73DRAFT_72969 [Epithele typhae]|uniref:uncharacterized protein n=1 Tax=Epithele typhae TaxID=378194 RepID=UPI00200769FB|nr:uncharacterized protein BXZ73DRAFT_72969 [Epithele typhae]KAH9946133.1 hypothetical protein BXZ73DRAFT_72969 [Epithele typhae]